MEDDDAPPPSVPSVVNVCDRDQNDVGIKSSSRRIAYDEMYEILSWMPAKSAIKHSSSLCKCLCNIHSEPRFIKKQSVHSCGRDNGFFLQRKLKTYIYGLNPKPNAIEFHVLPGQTGSSFGIPPKSLVYLSTHECILSSSNGLLLLGLQTHEDSKFKLAVGLLTGTRVYIKINVCNPATREWAPLRAPEGFKFILSIDSSPLIECYPMGLGVEFPNDYTIAFPGEVEPPLDQMGIVDLTSHDKKQLLIYCNGRWEEGVCDVSIEGRVVSNDMPIGIFSDATKGLLVHYLCHSNGDKDVPEYIYLEPYIAAFDIRGKKLSREIKLPKEAWHMEIDRGWNGSQKKLWIFKWNETDICLVRWVRPQGLIAAWVLEDCGCEGESWRMIMNMKMKELGIDENEWVKSMSVARGKGLLFATVPNKWRYCRRQRNVARVYVYVTEGENRGTLEVVGGPSFGL